MKTITSLFAEWKDALEEFHDNVQKDLDEIREQKIGIERVKRDILEHVDSRGSYIRDNVRIILSAPEIIIGDVDKDGVLMNTSASVVIRSGNVALEGVGEGESGAGSITSRASIIRQAAVDPGVDGRENVVKTTSEIITQAKSVVIRGESSDSVFPPAPAGPAAGVLISSDGEVEVEALLSDKNRQDLLSAMQSSLDSQVSNLKSSAQSAKQRLKSIMDELEDLVKDDEIQDEGIVRASYGEIDETHIKFKALTTSLSTAMNEYFGILSNLAEANRQLNAVKDQKKEAGSASSKFKDESTGTSVSISSESISLSSIDGDGNFRTNDDAGVNVAAKSISFTARDHDMSTIKDSSIVAEAEHIELSTANKSYSGENGEFPAEGDVRIVSKDILLEAVDYKSEKEEISEKALTEGGSMKFRAEAIAISGNDTEGKAKGQITANAKQLTLKSTDIDPESGDDKALAEGSSTLIVSDKVYAGAASKSIRSSQLQMASDKVGIFADTAAEIQQDGKAVLQLKGGDAAISGSKTTVFGETTVQGKTAFKSDVSGETLDVKNLKVQTSFKTPYTTEGISVPGAPSTASLSTSLKEEEVKNQK